VVLVVYGVITRLYLVNGLTSLRKSLGTLNNIGYGLLSVIVNVSAAIAIPLGCVLIGAAIVLSGVNRNRIEPGSSREP